MGRRGRREKQGIVEIRAVWRENRGGFPLERQMKGRRRMTATSDSWQVSDGQRERGREGGREGGGEKELLFSKANPWLCLTGKTQSHTERVYNLRCPLRHMTVNPRVSGRPLRVCLDYIRIRKKKKKDYYYSDCGQKQGWAEQRKLPVAAGSSRFFLNLFIYFYLSSGSPEI